MPGTLDPYGCKGLTGKAITVCIATGGAYSDGASNPEFDHEVPYLKFLFGQLGCTDFSVVRTEYTLAGVVPGMEGLVDKKEASFVAAKAAAVERAAAI